MTQRIKVKNTLYAASLCWIGVLGLHISFSKCPEDGSPVPKHVEFDPYHELYFIICYLVHLSVNAMNVFIFTFKHNV
jgi:hypothetical protein